MIPTTKKSILYFFIKKSDLCLIQITPTPYLIKLPIIKFVWAGWWALGKLALFQRVIGLVDKFIWVRWWVFCLTEPPPVAFFTKVLNGQNSTNNISNDPCLQPVASQYPQFTDEQEQERQSHFFPADPSTVQHQDTFAPEGLQSQTVTADNPNASGFSEKKPVESEPVASASNCSLFVFQLEQPLGIKPEPVGSASNCSLFVFPLEQPLGVPHHDGRS